MYLFEHVQRSYQIINADGAQDCIKRILVKGQMGLHRSFGEHALRMQVTE